MQSKELAAARRALASSTRVVVLSQNPLSVLPIVVALQQDGYDVTPLRAPGGLLASCRRLHQGDAELVVLDGSVGREAIAALEAVRSIDWAVPIALICAADDLETEQAARRLGVSACLRPPVSVDAVREVVSRLAPPIVDVAS